MNPTLDLPDHVPGVRVQPPTVYVEPVWEYRHLVRELAQQPPPDEAELNALGAEGWELAGVFVEAGSVHFYFKRRAA